MKPVLKPPRTTRLKLKYDELLSKLAFAVNLRCYIKRKRTKAEASAERKGKLDASATNARRKQKEAEIGRD